LWTLGEVQTTDVPRLGLKFSEDPRILSLPYLSTDQKNRQFRQPIAVNSIILSRNIRLVLPDWFRFHPASHHGARRINSSALPETAFPMNFDFNPSHLRLVMIGFYLR
jgi:hypothetical protein